MMDIGADVLGQRLPHTSACTRFSQGDRRNP